VLFATHDRSLLEIRPKRVVALEQGKAVDMPGGLLPNPWEVSKESDSREDPYGDPSSWGETVPNPVWAL
jgi:cell division transport system ATP-binding protein